MNVVKLGMRTALAALFVLPAASVCAATVSGVRPLSSAPRFIGLPAPAQAVNFAVHLPLRDTAQLEQMVDLQSDPDSPLYRHWLTPAQFRNAFGPTPASIARVATYLRSRGFAVTKIDTQLIHVTGTVASVERTFSVHLGTIRSREARAMLAPREALLVPDALRRENATVTSLAYVEMPKPQSNVRPLPLNRYSDAGPYWFDDLKQAYDYPAYPQLTGAGATIATVGYSDFSSADAKAYFGHELLGSAKSDLAPAPVPKHLVFPNSLPFNPGYGTSDEADLDVQQAAGSAPGATVIGIAAPATSGEDFLYVYSYIVDTNLADIVTTSYGECELFYTAAYNGGSDYTDILRSYHEMFLQGNSQGITFLFSSGDDSGRACPQPGYIDDQGTGASYVDVPGTSIWSDDPNVTSVGGTNLRTVPNPNPTASPLQVTSSAYVSEEANADRVLDPIDPYGTGNLITNARWGSGGGASVIFPAPKYQSYVSTGSTMRVDPDIAMHMGGCPYYIDPLTGAPAKEICSPLDSADIAVIGGELVGLIGTSASSPEFAGLLAVMEQQQGGKRFGNVNVMLYKRASALWTNGGLHTGIPFNNGVVSGPRGAVGYNPAVGLGTPDARLLIGIPGSLAAGDPQTPTNP